MKKPILLLSVLLLTACYPIRSQKFYLPPTPIGSVPTLPAPVPSGEAGIPLPGAVSETSALPGAIPPAAVEPAGADANPADPGSAFPAPASADSLVGVVIDALASLDPAGRPEENCPRDADLDPHLAQQNAYTEARVAALSRLLSVPEAANRLPQELEAIFAEGLWRALGVVDGAQIIEGGDGKVLAMMVLPACRLREQVTQQPPIYVMDHAGWFTLVGYGQIATMKPAWIADRWVGTIEIPSSANPLYAFVHVVSIDGMWQMRQFGGVNGPALTFTAPINPLLTDGYQVLPFVVDQVEQFYTEDYSPLPCDFGDAFAALESRSPSSPDYPVSAAHAIYKGPLTYRWDAASGFYLLTNETEYTITVVLSDDTLLRETPPTEEELAGPAGAYLRPGSWRDFCVGAAPASVSTDHKVETIRVAMTPVEKEVPTFRVTWSAPDAELASIHIGYLDGKEFVSTERVFPAPDDPMGDSAPQDHVLTTPEGHLVLDVWVGHAAVELCFTATLHSECQIANPFNDPALWAGSDNAPVPIPTPEDAANFLTFQFTGFCMTGQYAYYCTGYAWIVVDPAQVWVATGRVFLGQFYPSGHNDETAAEGSISVRHDLGDRTIRLCALNPAGQPGMLCALCSIMGNSQTCIPPQSN